MSLFSSHRRRHHQSLLLAGAALVGSVACSDDEGAGGPGGPDGPPVVRIATLRPAGGAPVSVPAERPSTPLCVEPGRDPARTIDVELAPIPNFTFAPPNSCGGTAQCGFVVLTVSGTQASDGGPASLHSRRIVSLTRSISVPFTSLGIQTDREPTLRFQVELFLAGTSQVLLSPDGGTYADEITARIAASCSGEAGGPDADAHIPDGTAPDATPLVDATLPDGSDAGAPDGGDASPESGDGGPAEPGDAGSDAAREASGPDPAAPDASRDAASARDATSE